MMALFGKRDTCPLCGEKVKGIFPHSIDGQKVCKSCYGEVDLPQDVLSNMTLDDFRRYMDFRTENQKLKENFQVTHQVDFGFLDTKFMFDMPQRLLCMNKFLDTTIFHGAQIKSFIIREDSTPLLEGSAEGLQRYLSTVPDRVAAMAPQIELFRMRKQMQRGRDNGQDNIRFDIPEPFRAFNLEIYFDHPYWTVFTADMDGPIFDNTSPDINRYLDRYHECVMTIEQLAQALMELAFPNGNTAETAPAAEPVNDVVTELQRFKALLDQGILTEEEFTAKKRQLLGL